MNQRNLNDDITDEFSEEDARLLDDIFPDYDLDDDFGRDDLSDCVDDFPEYNRLNAFDYGIDIDQLVS